MQIVREVLETRSTLMVARRHSICDSVVGRWVRQFEAQGQGAFDNAGLAADQQGSAEGRAVMAENDRLKKLLCEKDLEIAILKDLLK